MLFVNQVVESLVHCVIYILVCNYRKNYFYSFFFLFQYIFCKNTFQINTQTVLLTFLNYFFYYNYIAPASLFFTSVAKLVKNPVEVAPFMPILAPLLEKGIAVISDPECRKRFQAASEVLNKVGEKSQKEAVKQLQGLELVVHLKKSMLKNGTFKKFKH